jgi:hypothetical protein
MINTGKVGLGPPNDYGGAQPHPTMLSSLRKQGSRNVEAEWIPASTGMTNCVMLLLRKGVKQWQAK